MVPLMPLTFLASVRVMAPADAVDRTSYVPQISSTVSHLLVVNDSGKVAVLPCGSPSLGNFCCDNGKGFQCCATPTSVLTLGVGTTFNEGAITFTSMSTKPPSSVAATTSQTSSDIQTSAQVTSSSAAVTATSVPATSTFSDAPAASSSTPVASVAHLSSIQSQSSIESQPVPIKSTPGNTETTLASSAQSSIAAPTSSAVQPSASSTETNFAPSAQSSVPAPPTNAAQPSAESQNPSSTISQPFPTSTLIPSPSTAISSIGASSTFAIVPQSISVSSTPARASSAVTSLVAGDDDSDTSDPDRRTSAAVVAGASVASILVVTALTIVGLFLYRKRKAKRISKNFEASLGRTNIVNEKGSIRSGRTGFLAKTRSGGSGDSGGSFKSPAMNSPLTPVPAAAGNAWRPQRPPRPQMVPSQASSTFGRLLYDVRSEPF
ncbi:hypothetical protein L207DRAFT_566108 [Hyaloscypha variabilis F]|uniref:Mid2 domain-containing protein n=1 Tax=Hyaloscypha variabilis (strain UAMH 11265 / GT02V1 / F) TaxID=1149755 RepID=A0A2J6RQE2_HYAVF|nr:hypothetical protein L207DRAFT_566108 [Hyaloscypha variabilis F]